MLGATEYGVLAPSTDRIGAVDLARRIGEELSRLNTTVLGGPVRLSVRAGFDAVANCSTHRSTQSSSWRARPPLYVAARQCRDARGSVTSTPLPTSPKVRAIHQPTPQHHSQPNTDEETHEDTTPVRGRALRERRAHRPQLLRAAAAGRGAEKRVVQPPRGGGPNPAGLLSCSVLAADSVTQVVGPDGGTITVGPHTFVIPAGALDDTVSITAVAPSDTVRRVSFQPEG